MITFYSTTNEPGKALMLLTESANTGVIIVASTNAEVSYISKQAKEHSLKIPMPITISDYINILKTDGWSSEQKYICIVKGE